MQFTTADMNKQCLLLLQPPFKQGFTLEPVLVLNSKEIILSF